MSPAPLLSRYHSSLCDVYVAQHSYSSSIRMQVHSPLINTRYLPSTLPLLKTEFPSVLSTECFNERKLPFFMEVEKTEIGHLFEHVLLEYLFISHHTSKNGCPIFSGLTSWNWEKEPWGLFHVQIDAGYKNADSLTEALKKSILLTEKIMSSPPSPVSSFN